MKNHILQAVKILNEITRDGTYSNIALNQNDASDMAYKLVYGTLEKYIQINYIISKLIDKKTKNNILNYIRVGICAILIIDNVPTYALVSETVEAAKMGGKSAASGFINAVLKKVANNEYSLPSEGDKDYLSIKYSKPQWFIDRMLKEYGKNRTIEMLSEKEYEEEHIRVNERLTTVDKVKSKLDRHGIRYTESKCGGLNCRLEHDVKTMFINGFITIQSPSSMLAAQALGVTGKSQVLDLCSAPGGKAIYISELCPDAHITACDIHPHRVELIEKYAKRMKATNISTRVNDATCYQKSFDNAFDFVLVDAPCSCLGTYRKHPDVFLTRKDEDIETLSATQKKIIDNAVKYVRRGGILVYSTCTLFKAENTEIRDYILNNYNFELEKMDICYSNQGDLQILPHKEYDGFYIAKFKRVK